MGVGAALVLQAVLFRAALANHAAKAADEFPGAVTIDTNTAVRSTAAREGRVGYVRAEPAAPPRVARARLGHERAHPAGEAREGRTGIRDARQRKVRLFSFLFPYRQLD